MRVRVSKTKRESFISRNKKGRANKNDKGRIVCLVEKNKVILLLFQRVGVRGLSKNAIDVYNFILFFFFFFYLKNNDSQGRKVGLFIPVFYTSGVI